LINPKILELESKISSYLDTSNRINQLKGSKYWYPLNVATYGVEEVVEALDSMCAYQTSMSEKTDQFESEFGARFDSQAIMVNSGSSADLLITFALHKNSGGPLDSGDEILIPAVTWPTQLWSILMARFKAKLIDVDVNNMNISIESLEKSITSKTKALFVTHLMGNMPDMDQINNLCEKNDIILIEDSCESLGSKWNEKLSGTFGLASSFSFFFSHHITTMEGGMILTRDKDLANKFRSLRAHGWSREQIDSKLNLPSNIDKRYAFVDWGFNVRPTELQAGFGSVQLKRLDEFNFWRKNNALLLIKKLDYFKDYFSIMQVDEQVDCAWFALPIIIKSDSLFSRDMLTSYLEENGIETRPIVAGNLMNQPAIRNFSDEVSSALSLNGAEHIHYFGFYIGIRPFDSEEEINRIYEIFLNFFHNIH
jgi:CDP-6-deoxy-D-xylo-4-hexulose-3-dehydrase